MGFKEILKNLTGSNKENKEMFKQAQTEQRIGEVLEERKKSANERELERYLKEEREEAIKEELQIHRKIRDDEIKFGHNPLNTKNIMKAQWEVMKEKNMFKGHKDNIANQPTTVTRNNPNLLKNNRRLCGI